MEIHGANGAISWFQNKIGTYDKANWEITVERQELPVLKKLATEKLSAANLRSDLLDLDLIRGSTFTKAKPAYHWTDVSKKALIKVVFFPLYYSWWKQQTSLKVWLFFVALYSAQLIALGIYMTHQHDEDLKFISWPEAFVPFLAMILLGEMYIHVVSTNFTRPLSHKPKKKRKEKNEGSKRRRKQRKSTSFRTKHDDKDKRSESDKSADERNRKVNLRHSRSDADTSHDEGNSCGQRQNNILQQHVQMPDNQQSAEHEDNMSPLMSQTSHSVESVATNLDLDNPERSVNRDISNEKLGCTDTGKLNNNISSLNQRGRSREIINNGYHIFSMA